LYIEGAIAQLQLGLQGRGRKIDGVTETHRSKKRRIRHILRLLPNFLISACKFFCSFDM
jgi:hypothetical protein